MVKSTKKNSNLSAKTQVQRRAETTHKLLQCATKVFSEKGYQHTSVEDIAQHSGLTIRPIYHYFGNKKQLFEAVVEQQEKNLSDQLHHYLQESLLNKHSPSIEEGWQIFLKMAKQTSFRQIVLIDAPTVLGRERWSECSVLSQVKQWVSQLFADSSPLRQEIICRILFSALAEIAMLLANHPQPKSVENEIQQLLSTLLPEN